MTSNLEKIDLLKVPKHIGIIMDGNGRWAKKRFMPRPMGHREGAKRVIDIVEAAYNINVKSLSLYAFSTENWKRPEDEINALEDLLIKYIKGQLDRIVKNGVRINLCGDYKAFPIPVQKEIERALKETEQNDKMILNIALNYGSHMEIINACKNISQDVLRDKISVSSIEERLFEKYLYTNDQAPIDLLIRPGGEKRISNFMLYQLAYAEFYFTDILWPDFTKEKFYEAIVEYQNRNRRYGGL